MSRRRATLLQEVRALGLGALSWLLVRLPEGPLIRLADATGAAWYRFAPARAAQARRNLRRVAGALAERDTTRPDIRAAASDPRALERLVKAAFRHNARYYLEVARIPGLRARDLEERLLIETPEIVAETFATGTPVIFVGLHFGAIELPARFLALRAGQAVAPMETLDDPALQAWFVRTRGAAGVRIVGLREARRALLAALRAGIPVGLVGDRDLTGGGVPVLLFGAPATLPLGPAMLAVESGAPLSVVGVRRAGPGRYRGRLEPVATHAEGTRRERVVATTESLARAFERIVADAPEQWWAVFFPIWPDLEATDDSAPSRATATAISSETAETAADATLGRSGG